MKNWFILFILLPGLCFSQVKTIGYPKVDNYTKSEYNAATQNWDIAQDKKGFMYFANNDGVLKFNGSQWEFMDADIPLPVRSVFVDSKDRIFIGLIDNFGIMDVNSSGIHEFRSLRHLLSDNVGFSDIWKIHEIEEGIVFQSFEKLFIYNDTEEKIKVFSPEEKYRFSFKIDERLIVQEFGLGLYEYNGNFKKIPWSESIVNEEVLSIIKTEDNSLIIGTKDRLYKYKNQEVFEWECEANSYINTDKLFTSSAIFGNQFAFGTIRNGLIISDSEGNVLQHLNKDNSLQNNTILSLYADNSNNLWLGLDNGIDYVEINSPISYITEGGNIGTGYYAIVHNQNLYLGTNQGLFVKPFEDLSRGKVNFKLIEGTEGQVWSLTVENNQLICGHNFGTFIINGETATKIDSEPGGWNYIRLKKDTNTLIGGFYSGLVMFKNKSNSWQFYKKLEGFDESSRFLNEDENGFLWVAHGAKGVFKIKLDEELENIVSVTLYDSNSGLPSNEQNIVFEYNNQSFVSTIDGVYRYVEDINKFEKTDEINKIIGYDGRLKQFSGDAEGNIWFIGENVTGVLRLNEDLSYTQILKPFKAFTNKFVNEFEYVYPYNSNHTFFAIDNGFAHYSSSFSKSYNQSFNSYITKIEINYLDSVIFPQNITRDFPDRFPFRKNSFRFHYTSPFYENLTDLQYSFFLENYSEEWSEWTNDTYKDFTNLFEGDYTFHVKAKNVYGTESNISSYSFTIIPPWHRSKMAYYVYVIFFILLIFAVAKYILFRMEVSKKKEKLKHENELRKREEEFQKQTLIAEKEIIKLRNDKLRAEKIHRDKELANQTMNIVQKNKFLKRLTEEMQRIQNSTDDATVITKMALIKKRIKKEIDSQQQHQLFETYFEDVHSEFFKRLKDQFPQLTPNDLKLCAYIRMNIPTKEIATLLNISYRGVEISRYRLRKKLELSRDINLSTFLTNI